jgi:hypothetical protein
MTSSIRSQSIALRSSHRAESSSSKTSEGSEIHRTLPNCATGVSPSPGGPGGAGRMGRGRTRSGAGGNAVSDPSSSIGGEYMRDAGLRVAEDSRCGGVGGSITFGRCGRADDDGGGGDRRDTGMVCGGDHAGGGDLGRGGGEVAGSGCGSGEEVGGGGDFGILGSGRDLPNELVDGLIWVNDHDQKVIARRNRRLVRLPKFQSKLYSRRRWR